VHKGKKKLAEKARMNTLRHRIHQWSVSRLVEVLNNKPVHVVEVSEAYTSSIDPFTGKRIRRFNPSVTRCTVRGARRVRVVKIVLRIAGNGLDRAPCSVVEANDTAPRANPDHGIENIQEYLGVPWSGKRFQAPQERRMHQ